jgi:transcriptional regulator with XRE-family HTH domain
MVALQKRFGQLLAAQRKRRGLKQSDLSELAQLSTDMIAKLETGAAAPSFASIERLAEALKVDPAELFTYELGGRPYERRVLTDLVAELSRLSESELLRIRRIVKAALE